MLLLTLLGCPFVGDPGYDRIQDVDDDGLLSIRFGGRDCDDTNASVGDCDLDRDGFESVAFGGEDCDDTTAAVGPGQAEICDGLDNDCDGAIDDLDNDLIDPLEFFADDDGDGFGAGTAVLACAAPDGHVPRGDDCNDDFASIRPGEQEQCDDIDRNCDGDPLLGAVRQWYADSDGDGYGDPSTLLSEGCEAPEGAVSNPHDCDDTDANAHPIGFELPDYTEVCDGIDNDCDQLIDADDPGLDPSEAFLLFPDFDGDGFGSPFGAALRCALDPQYVDNDLDCDDTDALARPSAPPTLDYVEICDGFDNDCNGLIDAADPSVSLDSAFRLSPDVDSDGFGDASVPPVTLCELMPGFVDDSSDCDDGNPEVRPFVGEACETPGDDDCDGLFGSDDPDNDGALWYPDNDLDGVGVVFGAERFCETADRPGFSLLHGDCDDQNADVSDVLLWYEDQDGDGWASDDAQDSIQSCTPILGRTTFLGDCADNQVTINPGAPELCNQQDDNCNHHIDEGAPGVALGFLDADGDGFGVGEVGLFCMGVSPNNLDCDDTNPTVAPFATEFCDGIDNDCDDRIDEDDPDVIPEVYYPDHDLDGFGDPSQPLETCDPPLGHILDGTDCDPSNPARYFARFLVTDTPSTPSVATEVPTLAQALNHPGACPEDIEVVLAIDATLEQEMIAVGRLTIRGEDSGPRPLLTLPDGISLRNHGTLLLEHLELQVEGARSSGALRIGAATDGTSTELRDIGVFQDVDGPLLRVTAEDPQHERFDLSIDGLELGAISLDGVVQVAGPGGTVGMEGVSAVGTSLGAPVVRFGTIPLPLPLPNTLQIQESTFSDLEMATPMFHTTGGVQVAANRIEVHQLDGPGPVFCIEGTVCTGDGTVHDTLVVSDSERSSLTVQFSEFSQVAPGLDSRPWFVWQPGLFATTSTANTFRDVSAGTFAHSAGTTEPTGGLVSIRDRFIRHDANLILPNQNLSLTETFFIDSSMVVGADNATPTLSNVAVIEGDTFFEGVEYRIDELAVIGENWPLPPVDALDGISGLHHLPSEGPPHACEDCVADLLPDELVCYDPDLPLERIVPFPFETPTSAFTYGAVSAGSLGAKWHLDPNQDGLPSAWVVFHSSVAECSGGIADIIHPDDDPDDDNVTNAEEYLQNTWPCDNDTDHDGALDDVDHAPLDPHVQ